MSFTYAVDNKLMMFFEFMGRFFTIYSFLIFLNSCTNSKKESWPYVATYYAITADGIQTITFDSDSVIYDRIINLRGPLMSFDSTGYRTDIFKQKIIEISIEKPSIIFVYLEDKNQVRKMFFQLDSLKHKLSVLSEDTLFNSIKAAKAYRPDLNKKFLFDYYTSEYLSKLKNNPKVYNTDSASIYKFIDNFQKSLYLNKEKLKNTIGYEGLAFLIGRELLNKTFIDMNLNPFVPSDSIGSILKMIPEKNY